MIKSLTNQFSEVTTALRTEIATLKAQTTVVSENPPIPAPRSVVIQQSTALVPNQPQTQLSTANGLPSVKAIARRSVGL